MSREFGVDGGAANVHLDPAKLRHGLERLGAAYGEAGARTAARGMTTPTP